MQTILDQGAIDQLFNAQSDAAVAPPLPQAPPSLYNFGRAGQISNEQMRAISVVNDHFARNVMHTLGAWLRTQTQVVLVAGEQMPYSEFLSRIPEPAYVCLLRLEPLGGMGLMEIDLSLALTVVNLLLGGGGATSATREVTDIEDAILVSVIDVIVRELNAAWDRVGLQFVFEQRDHDGKVPRLMSAGERTLCVSFEIHLLGVQGVLNFCLPAVVLNTVHRRLLALSEEPKPKFEGVATRVAELMGNGQMRAVLRLPPVRLPYAALQSMTEGTVVNLPLPRHAQPELMVSGVRLCAGAAVARGEHRGARVIGHSPSFASTDAASAESPGEAG